MKFEEIFNKDGLYMSDGFGKGYCFSIKQGIFNDGTKESLIGLLKEYHEQELKKLPVHDAGGRSEQLKCDKCGRRYMPHLIKPLTICDSCADSF